MHRLACTAVLVAALLVSCTPPPRASAPTPEGIASPHGCSVSDELPRPPADRPHYHLRINARPDKGLIAGRLRVSFTPDLSTRRLVFRLWPNGPRQARAGTRLTTGPVSSRGRRLESQVVDPTTLVVQLHDSLKAHEEIVVELPWRLHLPGPFFDRISLDGDSIRLGSFFPLLPWRPRVGWVTDPPTTTLAETSVSPVADFDVQVRLPDGLEALASGREVEPGRWRAEAVRDFALAVGHFDLASGTAHAPDPVAVTVGVDEAVGESPRPYRDAAVRALEALSERYGPYPWPSFNLAITPNLSHAGIEYPTFVMQGEETLGIVTNHEVAHMWFYSLVGSNPAQEPWLDEGVTSFAQARIDSQLDVFTSGRIPAPARGRLGAGMPYWDRHPGVYFEGVYAQGVKALAAAGAPRSVDCGLKRYVRDNAYSIADSRALVDALEPSAPRAARVLRRFGVRL